MSDSIDNDYEVISDNKTSSNDNTLYLKQYFDELNPTGPELDIDNIIKNMALENIFEKMDEYCTFENITKMTMLLNTMVDQSLIEKSNDFTILGTYLKKYCKNTKKIIKILKKRICENADSNLALYDYYMDKKDIVICKYHIDFILDNNNISDNIKSDCLYKLADLLHWSYYPKDNAGYENSYEFGIQNQKVISIGELSYSIEALEYNSYNYKVYELIGAIYHYGGDMQSSLENYTKANEISPSTKNLYGIGQCYIYNEQGVAYEEPMKNPIYNVQKAMEYYDKVVKNCEYNKDLLDEYYFLSLHKIIKYYKDVDIDKMMYYCKMGIIYNDIFSIYMTGDNYNHNHSDNNEDERQLAIKYFTTGSCLERTDINNFTKYNDYGVDDEFGEYKLKCINSLIGIYEKEKNIDLKEDYIIMDYELTKKSQKILNAINLYRREEFISEISLKKFTQKLSDQDIKKFSATNKNFIAKFIAFHRMEYDFAPFLRFYKNSKKCIVCHETKFYNVRFNCSTGEETHGTCTDCFTGKISECPLCRKNIF